MSITINGNGTISGVSVGGLPDGIVDTDMIAASAVTTAKTSGLVSGITEADQWRYTSDVSMGQYATNLVTDWERNDTEFTKIGTGMSVNTNTGQSNSGHWTFPSTGIWLIQVQWQGHRASGSNHFAHHYIYGMNDGVQSNGFELASSSVGNANNDNRASAYMAAIFDVTNVSTHKVLFGYYDHISQTTTYKGSSSHNQNSYTFIKLGET